MLQFDSYNSLSWTGNGTTKNITPWKFEDLSVIDGKCEGQTIDPFVQVRFHTDNATFTFTFKNSSDMVNVVMDLEFVPDIVFKNGMTDPVSITTEINQMSSMENSYQCDAEQKYDGNKSDMNDTYNLELKFTRVHMQGFNLENGTFSKGDHCPADTESTSTLTPSTPTAPTGTTPTATSPTATSPTATTPTATTPTATTPTATTPAPNPSNHPKLSLSVKDDANNTCILLKAQMMIIVQYETNDMNKTAQIGVESPMVTGSCNSSSLENALNAMMMNQTMRITFQKDFVIDISFGKDGDNIWWDTLSVQGKYTPELFPNAKNANQSFNSSNNNLMQSFKAKTDGSYLCNADTKTDLKGGITLETWNLQYAAYQTDITDFSQDDVMECSADSTTNSIVPIAVGAALAGLVVIVLIAYLVGRRRNRKGYDSV